jgi:hypothetical protein
MHFENVGRPTAKGCDLQSGQCSGMLAASVQALTYLPPDLSIALTAHMLALVSARLH